MALDAAEFGRSVRWLILRVQTIERTEEEEGERRFDAPLGSCRFIFGKSWTNSRGQCVAGSERMCEDCLLSSHMVIKLAVTGFMTYPSVTHHHRGGRRSNVSVKYYIDHL